VNGQRAYERQQLARRGIARGQAQSQSRALSLLSTRCTVESLPPTCACACVQMQQQQSYAVTCAHALCCAECARSQKRSYMCLRMAMPPPHNDDGMRLQYFSSGSAPPPLQQVHPHPVQPPLPAAACCAAPATPRRWRHHARVTPLAR
jgi:hypothetical protein